MSSLPFTKYSGCGNDFVIVDNLKKDFPTENHKLIQHICNRRLGIGADGLILLEKGVECDHKMRIFNSDGFETEMCGNGLRCFVRFLQQSGYGDGPFTIESMKRTHYCTIDGDMVTIDMGDPTDLKWNFPLTLADNRLTANYLDTGVPHVVIFTAPIEEIDVATIGSQIRHHPSFKPRGTNVNFAEIEDNDVIHIRTFERGVEAETLACGTGATATALAAAHCFGLPSPIAIKTKSQDLLYVSFELNNGLFQKITLTGAAERVFHGHFPLIRTPSFAYN
jgi:diaminopimelate epimerase